MRRLERLLVLSRRCVGLLRRQRPREPRSRDRPGRRAGPPRRAVVLALLAAVRALGASASSSLYAIDGLATARSGSGVALALALGCAGVAS
jgi:hypothetical protein